MSIQDEIDEVEAIRTDYASRLYNEGEDQGYIIKRVAELDRLLQDLYEQGGRGELPF